VCAVALAIACSKQSASPTSPSAAAVTSGNAAGDGSTLKVSAPTPVSPINGVKLAQGDPVFLTINNSTAAYANSVPLRYEFAVVDAAGNQVYVGQTASGAAQSSISLQDVSLEAEQTYQWHARAFYGDYTGPWSPFASFVAPQNDGYIRGNELYDPLINGKTVGTIHGPIQWWPGGIHLDDFTSYIHYVLPQTLEEGEFSLFISNIKSLMAGGKTKLFAMSKGFDDIITNEYRFTMEKRGDGTTAWRFIARDDQIDTEGGERVFVDMSRAHEYFYRAAWRANHLQITIREDGVDGRIIYDFGKNWDGRGYVPDPHVIYVGAPVGRSGPEAATVPGMVARQVWVSSRPRPGFANK
jgi:hypothetical protein